MRTGAAGEFEIRGDRTVAFFADIGEGPSVEDAKLEWDFNGDGEADATEPSATWTFTGAGPHKATLRVVYGVFERELSVTRTVEFPTVKGAVQ